MNAKQTAQLAAWDQIERDLTKRLDHFSDDELLRVVAECETRRMTAGPVGPVDLLLNITGPMFLSFCLLYEHRRRNGGFGREGFNPCEEMTP